MCVEKKIPYLQYGRFVYGTKGIDSLTKFKIHNGFRQYNLPRYYVPLNTKGKIVLALKLHKGPRAILPGWLVRPLLRVRKKTLEFCALHSLYSNKRQQRHHRQILESKR